MREQRHLLGKPPSGIEAKHLLTGLAACGACGGGIMARYAGRTASGRRAYYICTSYNNHGATACANNLPLPMQLADQAVLSTLSDYILRPDVVEGAIEDAVAALRPSADTPVLIRLCDDIVVVPLVCSEPVPSRIARPAAEFRL